MRIVNFLLATLALVAAVGAGGYSWWASQRQVLDGERLMANMELELERRLNRSENDLDRRLATLDEVQKQLAEQLRALSTRHSSTLADTSAQLGAVEEKLARISQGLQQADYSWLLENISGTLQVTERAIYLRLSATVRDSLVDQVLLLINKLPPAQAALLTTALQQDLERMPQTVGPDLPALSRQIDEVEALLEQLPRACCPDFVAPAGVGVETSTGFWEFLGAAFRQAVRLRRVADELPAQPDRRERMLLRAGLGLRLGQARAALWNYDQAGWQSAWQALREDASRALAHDPSGQESLDQAAESLAALSVTPVAFRFDEIWRALELSP